MEFRGLSSEVLHCMRLHQGEEGQAELQAPHQGRRPRAGAAELFVVVLAGQRSLKSPSPWPQPEVGQWVSLDELSSDAVAGGSGSDQADLTSLSVGTPLSTHDGLRQDS